LQSNSPAINSGSNPLNLTADQRGTAFSRVVGGMADIGAFEQQQVSPALIGDYNRDSVVDAADYVLWRKTEGTVVEIYAGADGNGDTDVDHDDYDLWAKGFGEVLNTGLATGMIAASSSASVDEGTDTSFGIVGGLIEFRAATALSMRRSNAIHAARPAQSAEYQDLALLVVLAERDWRFGTEVDRPLQHGVPDDDPSEVVLRLTSEVSQLQSASAPPEEI
jgi:hypothetical protein